MPPQQADSRPPFEILVVDDEPDIRDLLAEFFRERKYDVAVTGDGRAAIAAIERNPSRYGLVLTDLNLPGADGLEVLKAAKTLHPAGYVVIITGFASLDSAIQAVRLGAYDYLTKPFSLGQIEVLLRRILDRLALDAENRQLARQIGQRGGPDGSPAVATRLDQIEARLGRIETTLREIASRR